jgi:hypothetical protein
LDIEDVQNLKNIKNKKNEKPKSKAPSSNQHRHQPWSWRSMGHEWVLQKQHLQKGNNTRVLLLTAH